METNQDTNSTPRFLSIEDVCELFQLPKATIYKWTSRAKDTGPVMPHVKIGKHLRFERTELEQWIDSKRVTGRIDEAPAEKAEETEF